MDDPTPADVPPTREPEPAARPAFPARRDLGDGVVLLREPLRSDGDAIVAGASDADVVRFTRVPSPYGPEDLDAILRISAEGWAAGTDAVFAVCAADDPDELLGLLGLHGVELDGDPGGTAEIGYWLRPEARGRGLMTRAVVVASRWAFDELGLAVVEWVADAGYVVSGVLGRVRGGAPRPGAPRVRRGGAARRRGRRARRARRPASFLIGRR